MSSSLATAPKTCWDILIDKQKSQKHTAFAVVLEGRVLGDDGRDLGH